MKFGSEFDAPESFRRGRCAHIKGVNREGLNWLFSCCEFAPVKLPWRPIMKLMLLGLLLFSSGIQLEQTKPPVEAASQEQSTTANTEAQQREREEYIKSIRVKLDE